MLSSLTGRVSFFTSGSENPHFVEPVKSGVRYAVTVPFTCDPEQSIITPTLDQAMTVWLSDIIIIIRLLLLSTISFQILFLLSKEKHKHFSLAILKVWYPSECFFKIILKK